MGWWEGVRGRVAAVVGGTRASAEPGRTVPAPAGPAAPDRGGRGDWAALPPVQRQLDRPVVTVARLDTFGAGLAAHQDPRSLAPLSHHVDRTTGGLSDGLLDLAPGTPRSYPAGPALEVPPRVQRSAAAAAPTLWRSTAAEADDLATVPLQAPTWSEPEEVAAATVPEPAARTEPEAARAVDVPTAPPLPLTPVAPVQRVSAEQTVERLAEDPAPPSEPSADVPDEGPAPLPMPVVPAPALLPVAEHPASEPAAPPSSSSSSASLQRSAASSTPPSGPPPAPLARPLPTRSLPAVPVPAATETTAAPLPWPDLELPVARLAVSEAPTSAPGGSAPMTPALPSVQPPSAAVGPELVVARHEASDHPAAPEPGPAAAAAEPDAPLSGFAAAIARMSGGEPPTGQGAPGPATEPGGAGPTTAGPPLQRSATGGATGLEPGFRLAQGASVAAPPSGPVSPEPTPARAASTGPDVVVARSEDSAVGRPVVPTLVGWAPTPSAGAAPTPVEREDAAVAALPELTVARQTTPVATTTGLVGSHPLEVRRRDLGPTFPVSTTATVQRVVFEPTTAPRPRHAGRAAAPAADLTVARSVATAAVGTSDLTTVVADRPAVPLVGPPSLAPPRSTPASYGTPTVARRVADPAPAAPVPLERHVPTPAPSGGPPVDHAFAGVTEPAVALQRSIDAAEAVVALERADTGPGPVAGPPAGPVRAASFATMFAGSTPSDGVAGFTEVPLQRAGAEPAPASPPPPPEPEPEVAPAPAPAAGPAAAGPSAPGAGGPGDLDEMARRLFEPLSARLRAELWLDRERAGLMTDAY